MKHALVSSAALATFVALSSAATTPVRAQEATPAEKPAIEILAWAAIGTGCPPGTATLLPGNSDGTGQAVTITFDKYETKVNSTTDTHQLDCEIQLKLKAPRGRRTAVSSIKYDGIANIKVGQTAKFSAFYYWRDQPIVAQSQRPTTLPGPYNDQFTWQDKVGVTQYSACETQEIFTLSTFMTLQNSSPPALGSFRLSQTEVDIASNVKNSIVIDFLLGPCQQP